MGRLYVTSDLHFGHIRLQEGLRGQHTDELIIDNWNKVVKNNHDRIYVLGDFCMQKPTVIRDILPKLKGEIILIGGNHDNIPCAREYMRQGIPVIGCLRMYNLWFTHIPVSPTEIANGIKGNVHGHIHTGGYMQSEDGHWFTYDPGTLSDPRYFNVNTEFHNYQLVPMEEIMEYYQNLTTNENNKIPSEQN